MTHEDFDPPVACVAVGASAGAFAALEILFSALSRAFRPALVVVVHLPAHRPSRLARVFGRRTELPVLEAEDKQPVQGGTVYFAPPGYHLLIERTQRFALDEDGPQNHSQPSIDLLFESAALAYGQKLAGMLLTGANDDGARGLQAIARAGGRTFVEDPASAEVPAMPQAALDLFTPDATLGLRQLAVVLGALGTPAEVP